MSETMDQLIQTHFEQALDCPSAQREAFLRDQIGDEDIRREVRALLEAHDAAGDYLEHPPTATGVSVDEIARWANPDEHLVGETIGNCRLDRVIASGGMGTVYEAQQAEPKRRVAVKLMRRRLQSRHARRRFEYETQILARLRHPGIAQILEAGTQDGEPLDVPYFVMEYIEDARSLIDYAREQDLSFPARIELFLEICEAVHHGHLRGVIHRDLKPENILVDREGRPRVIDFGVAKATNQDLAISTLITETGQLVGTLQYMSPEQCDGETSEIDLRSDVYSLGVVLYELLCDQLPYDLSSAKPVEALRVVREHAPRRPSDTNRMLRGDLDTIVLKTLAKETNRRYESAAALAADLQRYLDSEPIAARPPSAIYQFRKFTHRNRTLVGAGAIITVLLITGVVSTSVGWIRATRAEANSARAEADAVRELKRAEEVTRIIREMLSSIKPEVALGADITLLKGILDDTAMRLEADEIEDELIQAELHKLIGETFLGLGLTDEALLHLQAALELQTQQLGDHDPIVLRTNELLATVHHDLGEYEEAERIFRKLLEQSAEVESLELFRQSLTASLANTLHRARRFEESDQLYVQLIETRKRVLGHEHEDTLTTMSHLASAYRNQGRHDEAESLLMETLAIQKRVLGKEHKSTLGSMFGLAFLYEAQDRYDEAESLFLERLEIQKRVLGEENKSTLETMSTLAGMYLDQGRNDEAEPLYLQELEIETRIYGDEHPMTLGTMHNLAGTYRLLGRFDESESLYVQTLDTRKRVLGADAGPTLTSMFVLGHLYVDMGQYAEAESMYKGWLEIRKRVYGAEDRRTLASTDWLAKFYLKQERYAEAELLMRDFLDSLRRLAELPGAAAFYKNDFAWHLMTVDPSSLRDPAAALEYAREACDMTNYEHPGILDTLALAQFQTDDVAGAVETQRRAVELSPDNEGYRATLDRYEAALDAGAGTPSTANADH